MAIEELYRILHERKIWVALEDGRLWVDAPEGAMTPQLLEELRAHKEEILEELRNSTSSLPAQSLQEVPMSTALEITLTNGEYCLDSRILAQRLGYEHETVTRNIQRHKSRLEAKSFLRQNVGKTTRDERGRGRPEVYYLLDERQCLILTGSLKKGEEADEWHDTLVDAFLQARDRVRQLETKQTQPSLEQRPLNDLWYQRQRLFYARTRLNEGYWCVYGELLGMIQHYPTLVDNALPDGSAGGEWMKYVRQYPEQFDMRLIKPYDHYYPDKRGKVPAKQYPYAWLGAFRLWFDQIYLKEHYPAYLKSRQLPDTEKLQAISGSTSQRASRMISSTSIKKERN